MRIAATARKHGIADQDINHAVAHVLCRFDMDDDFLMYIGPATNGALLEVGIIGIKEDSPVIIHAMPMRKKFQQALQEGGDRHEKVFRRRNRSGCPKV